GVRPGRGHGPGRPAAPGSRMRGGGLAADVRKRRIVVVCGSGGVGKTTVAAALAVGQAREGRRTVVMTVDPARRLVSALGLPKAPGEQRTVRLGDGVELDAIMLDTKRTFDELVARHAASAERRA